MIAKKPDCYRLEISSLYSHKIMIDYLEHFPFQGLKYTTFYRWWRIYNFRKKKEHLTEPGINKVEQLCKKINNSCVLPSACQKKHFL